MEMHQVKYFLAAARTLNFTRAAMESNVTQPSLTRAIHKLEEEFGGLLFRRERSLTHLTELGRQMVPHLQRTYEAAQAAKMLAKGMGKAELAPLALGIAGNIPKQLADALAEVANTLPGLQLSLSKGNAQSLLQAMLKGDIDAAILVESRDVPDRIDTIALTRQDFVIIVPANCSLAGASCAVLQDLGTVYWIEGDGDVAHEFQQHCSDAGIELDFRHTAADDGDLVGLVASGLGCAVVPRTEKVPQGVATLTVDGLSISRTTVLASVAGRERSIATNALIRAVRARSWPSC